jgi:hypothetical protein
MQAAKGSLRLAPEPCQTDALNHQTTNPSFVMMGSGIRIPLAAPIKSMSYASAPIIQRGRVRVMSVSTLLVERRCQQVAASTRSRAATLILLCHIQKFLTSALSCDRRDAARAARQRCHESSAQCSSNGRDGIWDVPFRPQWRSPAGDRLWEA